MTEEVGGYGYVDDESEIGSGGSSMSFGLNPKVRMTKFELIANAGKDGAEAEALDIVFNINGKDKSMRKFPVTKAFAKDGNNTEVTDPKAPEMQEAYKDLNALITHVMHCFVSKENLIIALSVPMTGFSDYVKILMGLLPANYADIDLDLFGQYQWQISGDNDKTYLEIPKKMKQGKWLCVSVPAQNPDGTIGQWTEVKKENPNDNDALALSYVDGMGTLHPFTRNGWFMNSNYANQQKDDSSTPPASAMAPTPQAEAGTPGAALATAKGW